MQQVRVLGSVKATTVKMRVLMMMTIYTPATRHKVSAIKNKSQIDNRLLKKDKRKQSANKVTAAKTMTLALDTE